MIYQQLDIYLKCIEKLKISKLLNKYLFNYLDINFILYINQ